MAAYECDIKVADVLVYSNGTVNLRYTGRNNYPVCNLNSEWKGVGVTICAVWFTLLEGVGKRNGTNNLYFEGKDSCATLQTYAESSRGFISWNCNTKSCIASTARASIHRILQWPDGIFSLCFDRACLKRYRRRQRSKPAV